MISVVIYPGSIDGPYSLHLANALTKFAKVTYVFNTRNNKSFDGKALNKDISLLPFRKPRIREPIGIIEMHRLSRRIRQIDPDVIHFQGNGLWESILLRFLGKCPIVNTVHDPVKHIDNRTALNTWTMRDMIKKSSGLIVHSEGLKNLLLKHNNFDPERIFIHAHGIFDYYLSFETNKKERTKSILYFGNLRLNKGLDLLMKAFASVKNQLPEWTLVIAGKGSSTTSKSMVVKIKAKVVGQTGIPEELLIKYKNILGTQLDIYNRFIEDDEVGDFFSSAGIVALPYRHGSQSGVLAIAAAFECPVLATTVGAIPEMLDNEKNALLVQPGSVTDLADGLLRLCNDTDLRTSIGTELLKLSKAEWAWNTIAENTVLFYENILNNISHN